MGWYLAVFVLGLILGVLGGYRLGKGAWPWRAIKVDL